MTGASLFSGIGAPEVSAPWIDWLWSADIDEFANAVRAHHWPDVPNLGDVAAIDGDAVERPDVLVFGSPCQSFSVAGKRLGLDDPRGNLALIALRLVQRIRPRWFVFENVPGLLSSDDGRDFETLCRTVTECGYGWAWRMLDARHFGVPQRRRRIFLVGCAGDDWRPPAAVLFEPESLRGHPAPGRGTGEDVARCLSARAQSSHREDSETLISSTGDTAHCLNAGGMGRQDFETKTLIAVHGSQDPIVSTDTANPVQQNFGQETCVAIQERAVSENPDAGPQGSGFRADGQAYTLEARTTPQAVAQVTSATVRRLTPTECERLQGFPDRFTDIPWRGGRAPDGRRYAALGNSMAVPVIGWVLERIRMYEEAAAPRGEMRWIGVRTCVS